MKIRIVFIILISLLSPCYSHEVNEHDVIEFQLQNGMKFLLVERHSVPSFSSFIRVRLGSIDENIENSGISHLIEHLFLKEISSFINKNCLINTGHIQERGLKMENIDGVVSQAAARTTKEFTTYYFTLNSKCLELLISKLGEKLQGLSFDNFGEEKLSVINEIKKKSENITRNKLFELFISDAFLIHPYRMPTWGSEYSLRKINKEETKYFFRNYYVPSNIVISIVGDFKTKECIRIIKKSFHILPDQKKIRDYPDEPVLNGERRIKIRTNSSPYIFIGFYKPTYPNKEDYVLDLATQLLNEKLSFSLVSKRKMAAFVRVFTTPGIIFKNLLVIESIPISCSSSLLEKAIYEEIKKVRTNLNDSNLFAIVKERIKQKQKEILKSNYLLANNLSYYEAAYQNWKYIFEYANIIDQISLDDVQKCIFKYLHEDNRIVALIENLDN